MAAKVALPAAILPVRQPLLPVMNEANSVERRCRASCSSRRRWSTIGPLQEAYPVRRPLLIHHAKTAHAAHGVVVSKIATMSEASSADSDWASGGRGFSPAICDRTAYTSAITNNSWFECGSRPFRRNTQLPSGSFSSENSACANGTVPNTRPLGPICRKSEVYIPQSAAASWKVE